MLGRLAARLIPPLGRLRRAVIDQAERNAALARRIRDLEGRLKERERLLSLATEGAAELQAHAAHCRAATRRAMLLARSEQPIVVGPWCGEVGFELLYWIPFVRWIVERSRVDSQRLIVVTRGGASAWYRDLTTRGVEILDLVDSESFRNHADTWKQHRLSPFDRQLIAAVVAEHGVGRARLLHPQVMYRLLTAYWKEEAAIEPIDTFLRYKRLPQPAPHTATTALPSEYVAAKFYFSQSFPDTAANRAFVQRAIAAAAEQIPVVLLTTGVQLDDHRDATVASSPRVRILQVDGRDNLASQSAVVAGARRFIGTYGGFSYLAPLFGVDSVSYFSNREKLVPFHLNHAHRVFGSLNGGRFMAVDVADAHLVSMTSPPSVAPAVH